MISTLVSVHLLTIPQSRRIAFATAVVFGTLIGPSQVGARLIELLIARYHHPIWTKLVSTLLVTVGLAILWAGVPAIAASLVFYGAGIVLELLQRNHAGWSLGRDPADGIDLLFQPFAIVGGGSEVKGQMLRMEQIITREGPDRDVKDQYFTLADGVGTKWLGKRYSYTRRPPS